MSELRTNEPSRSDSSPTAQKIATPPSTNGAKRSMRQDLQILPTRSLGWVFLIATALLLIATFTDQDISNALINSNDLYGVIMQTYGEFPPAVLGALAMLTLAGCLWKTKLPTVVRSIGTVLLGWASFLFILNWCQQVADYRRSWEANKATGLAIGLANNDSTETASLSELLSAAFAAAIITALLCVVTWYFLRQRTQERLHAIAIAAVIMLAVIWVGHGINDQMKTLWGRFRPYEVAAGEGPFSVWYHINGNNGHRSFPSGHTQEGTTLAALAILLYPISKKAWRIALWFGIFWGGTMALSRVIVGAHWPTDTIVSFMLTLGVVCAGLWLVSWLTKPSIEGNVESRAAV
ncbi:MAG: phosphatase PAP2 family protein [Corynebacterium sp.]|nr:phosphatase PAP2 family protein [Corynebacterium sp.]